MVGEKGRKKEGNQDGGCNRRHAAGGLFTVTEGGQERDGGVRPRKRGKEGRLGGDEKRRKTFREKPDYTGSIL